MYALPKGNTKEILAKTRRGISQKYESFGNQKAPKNKRDTDHLPVNEISSTAKPIFHNRTRKVFVHKDVKEITPQHQEMIKYVHETWKLVIEDYNNCSKNTEAANNGPSSPNHNHNQASSAKISYYKNKSASVPKFEPFDLETFWGQRLYQNLTRST